MGFWEGMVYRKESGRMFRKGFWEGVGEFGTGSGMGLQVGVWETVWEVVLGSGPQPSHGDNNITRVSAWVAFAFFLSQYSNGCWSFNAGCLVSVSGRASLPH